MLLRKYKKEDQQLFRQSNDKFPMPKLLIVLQDFNIDIHITFLLSTDDEHLTPLHFILRALFIIKNDI